MLHREGSEPPVSTKFYRAVVQAVILFGSETWVLSAPMIQRLEEAHVGFLWQVVRKKAKRLRDEYWRQVMAKTVL